MLPSAKTVMMGSHNLN